MRYYLSIIKEKIKALPFYFMRIFKINSKRIFVTSYYGKGYGDNPKYVVEELLGEGYDIWWLVQDESIKLPSEIKPVLSGTKKEYYIAATAKVWIDNARKSNFYRKRKKQYYINTLHGGIPLKKIEKDAEGLSKSYIRSAKKDSKMTNLMISNSRMRTNLLKKSFWYSGEVMECGSPKIEVLINKNNIDLNEIRKKIGIDSNVKIVFYAPTFRSNYDTTYYISKAEEIISVLEKRFTGEWVFMYRMHPNMTQIPFTIKAGINVTMYPDMQELLLITDVLISDYSGIIFETLHMKTNVFLYVPDMEEYDRGFYYDFSELPFPYAKTISELKNEILNFDQKLFYKKIDAFIKKQGLVTEYGAAKKVAERIKEIIENN